MQFYVCFENINVSFTLNLEDLFDAFYTNIPPLLCHLPASNPPPHVLKTFSYKWHNNYICFFSILIIYNFSQIGIVSNFIDIPPESSGGLTNQIQLTEILG